MSALQGIRVLDLSRLLPGPYATLLLSDMGADVVKIEDPGAGDYLRAVAPEMFERLNRGKRSCVLDLKAPEGRDPFLALAARADVVVESFRPGVMERLGCGWNELHAKNPRLVLASISGYGARGPYRDRAGHDLGYIALAGVLWALRGQVPRVQLADMVGGGLFCVVGVLAALHERARTGEGRHVQVSMTDNVAQLLAAGTTDVLDGTRPCYSVYRSSDGIYFALAALEPKFWLAFCDAAGRTDLADKGLDTDARPEVEKLFASRTSAQWLAFAAMHDVCLEPVLPPNDWSVASPPLTSPREGRAPEQGEHTAQVLGEIGIGR
jgi:crotonobetainyl-CoA:carnitine CoA-transferase CaiB-like acyl-CoA transferase